MGITKVEISSLADVMTAGPFSTSWWHRYCLETHALSPKNLLHHQPGPKKTISEAYEASPWVAHEVSPGKPCSPWPCGPFKPGGLEASPGAAQALQFPPAPIAGAATARTWLASRWKMVVPTRVENLMTSVSDAESTSHSWRMLVKPMVS